MPDLIIADIHLSDGLSFELFKNFSINTPIIFCTAYDEFALNAFEVNGIDYILKPIEREKLVKSFEKIDQLKSMLKNTSSEYVKRFQQLLSQFSNKYKENLLSYFQGKITPIPVSEINFIHLEQNVAYAYVKNKRFTLREKMEELEESLDPQMFFRANRQFIIHRNYLKNIESIYGRKFAVELLVQTPETIVISKVKSPDFLKWIEGNVA